MESSPFEAGPAPQDTPNSNLNLTKVVLSTGVTHCQPTHPFLIHFSMASNIVIRKLSTVANAIYMINWLIGSVYKTKLSLLKLSIASSNSSNI